MEQYIPLSRTQWDAIQRLNEGKFPDRERTVESLRRKFSDLHRTSVPSGDPNIPMTVLRAKAIREKIKERADIGGDSDIEEAVDEAFHESFQDSGDDDDVADDSNGHNSHHGKGESEGDREVANQTQTQQSSQRRQEVPQECLEQELNNANTHCGQRSTADRVCPSNRSTPGPSTTSPRPLVARDSRKRKREGDDGQEELMSQTKINMLQEQQYRQEEIRRRQEEREDDRRRKAEERELGRERREADRQRHEQFMQMMLTVITKSAAPQQPPN